MSLNVLSVMFFLCSYYADKEWMLGVDVFANILLDILILGDRVGVGKLFYRTVLGLDLPVFRLCEGYVFPGFGISCTL